MQSSFVNIIFLAFVLIGSQALEISRQTPVTPVEKVIALLNGLKSQIATEGQNEATTYNNFACFCKTTTETKSTSITTHRDTIDTLASNIEVNTATQADKANEVQERKVKQEQKQAELDAEKARCLKAKEEYYAFAADLSKAIRSLDNAITSLQNAKPAMFQKTLHVIHGDVATSLKLAGALNLKVPAPKRQAVIALLQQDSGAGVDPLDPAYKYRSDSLITTLNQILTEFRGKKQDADDEHTKTEKVCKSTIGALTEFLQNNQRTMDTLDGDILLLRTQIADDRTDLVEEDELLKDDQQYLKDLAQRCESRAKDWDQRSALRADEIQAITGALTILEGNIISMDSDVNLRASLLSKVALVKSVVPHVQLLRVKNHTVARSLLQEGSLSAPERRKKVAALLGEEGKRLGSKALTALASKVSGDPFGEVKVLIQKLIERLLAESTAEATKKGYCDTELAKASQDRGHRHSDAMKLNAELGQLEVKQKELEAEIDSLTTSIVDLKEDLNQTTVWRGIESDQNHQTISEAKDGLKLMSVAIAILNNFYKQAAKATVLVQASPVDENTDGAGFAGAYKGKQVASKGVIGMLEVIKTDFERTVRMTEAQEAAAHADFVNFDRASRADISGREMKKELDEQDLQTTKDTIAQKMDDLQSSMDLVDSAIKVTEALKPTCIDTSMSYADRVAKFNEEISALKKALCILDEDGVEQGCTPQSSP